MFFLLASWSFSICVSGGAGDDMDVASTKSHFGTAKQAKDKEGRRKEEKRKSLRQAAENKDLCLKHIKPLFLCLFFLHRSLFQFNVMQWERNRG